MSWTQGKKGRKGVWGLACAPRRWGLLLLEMSYWCDCTNEVQCNTSGSKNLPLLITVCFEADVKKPNFREYILPVHGIFWSIFLIAFSVKLQWWRKPLKESRGPGQTWRGHNDRHQKNLQFSSIFWMKVKNTNWQHSSHSKQLYRQKRKEL